MNKKPVSKEVRSVKHLSKVNTKSINKAVEKASKDRDFISNSVKRLDGLRFPAYKYQLIEFLNKNYVKNEILALYESLNGTILYRDQYHIKKAFEQNNPEAKQENQITDETRTNLRVKKVNPTHKRKDYPEVPATAPKDYVCALCGKSFLRRDDLIHHEEFEFKEK